MRIFAQSEQDQVETGFSYTLIGKLLNINLNSLFSPQFGGYGVDVFVWNVATIQPRLVRHPAVAFRIVGGQAAFVAKPDVPAGPVVWFGGQRLVKPCGRAAAGEHDVEGAALVQGLSFCLADECQCLVQPVGFILGDMPACLHVWFNLNELKR